MIFEDNWIHFFSISKPLDDNSLAISALVTDPNNLSLSRDLAVILSSNFSSFLTTFWASEIASFCLFCDCLIFSAKTFFADEVASTALPWGLVHL